MIRRAVSNLVHNALKYGRQAWITISEDAERVYVHIDDDGPGIPAAKRREAFKAFQRLDEARNQNIEGVGLGLAIARDIAQIHGGKIVLDDSPKGGLRATLALPI